MSLRLPLVALAALTLTGCDLPGRKQKAAAPAPAPAAQASRDCCCKVCPTDAAPSGAVAASGDTRATVRRAAHTPARAEVRRRRDHVGGGYERSTRSYERRAYVSRDDETLAGGRYGGRYGVSGRAVSGVSISVEESESFSERSRYSESSSSYGSRGGVAYASGYGHAEGFYYEDRDGRVRRGGPAGTDRAGYLTWPGKVED